MSEEEVNISAVEKGIPVVRQFGYLIDYRSNVKRLTSEVEKLDIRARDVKNDIQKAEEKFHDVYEDVTNWLRNAEKTIQDSKACLEDETNMAKATGWFPNLKVRRSLSKAAKKMTLEVEKLLIDGNFANISGGSRHPNQVDYSIIPDDPIQEGVTKLHEEGASSSEISDQGYPQTPMDFYQRLGYRLPYTQEILRALQNDNAGVKFIGISGAFREIDTVTTKEFIRRIKQKNQFEHVVMAVVSKYLDVNRIQSDVAAEMFDLTFEEYETLDERANKLRARLSASDKRWLLIFADVWGTLDWDAIGIPVYGYNRGCKIMLISQLSPDVFSELSSKNFELLSEVTPRARTMEFASRNPVIREAMDALTDEESNPIVLCGMGGIGKTTLLKEIGAKASDVGLFDKVAVVEFTQTYDLRLMQEQLAEGLGLTLTKEDGAAQLRKRLSESTNKVLIILDNVWAYFKLDLWTVGIPIFHDPKCCKLLVSSREQDVFKMKSIKIIPIVPLEEPEAWNLFKEMAGDNIESDPELRPIAQQVLEKCHRLPIAISTLGSALQKQEISFWKDTLVRLEKPFREDEDEMTNNIYQAIKLSYDSLKSEEAKSCFLLCCLYPKSTNIPVLDLVKYVLGLGDFQDVDSMETGRDRVKSLVSELKCCFLLSDSDDEKSVRMHDTVHEVGSFIAFDLVEGKFAIGNRDSSLHNDGVTELSRLVCTCSDDIPVELPPTIVDGMEALKVLHLWGMCKNLAVISPGTISGISRSQEELYMWQSFDCWEAEKLASTETTNWISQLEDECKEDVDNEDKQWDLEMWKSLHRLAVKQPANTGEHRRVVQNACHRSDMYTRWADSMDWTVGLLSELLSLSHLTCLQVVLPPVDIILRTSQLFHKLERFKIFIGRQTYPNQWDAPRGNYLRLNDLNASSLVGGGISFLLKKTNVLELKMKNLTDTLNILDAECCAKLKSLAIEDCYAMKYLIDMTLPEQTPCEVFPLLSRLDIKGASSLKQIIHGELPKGSLKCLKNLVIQGLPELTNFWKIKMPSELEEIDVSDCSSLEGIFEYEDEAYAASTISQADETSSNVSQPGRVEEIDVPDCSSLEGTLVHEDEAHAASTISLADETSSNVAQPAASTISQADETSSNVAQPAQVFQIYKKVDSSHIHQGLKNLTTIKISDCNRLRYLMSPLIARGLVNLKTLVVGNCMKIKEIIAATEGEETEDTIILSQLSSLRIWSLPNLATFSQGNYSLDLPLLESIEISHCKEMIKFCSGFLSIPCEVEITVTYAGEYVKEELNKSRRSDFSDASKEREAWNLFKKMAGDYIESDELRPIARDVLGKCHRLPIAISTLGRALQKQEISFWKDTLVQLEKPFKVTEEKDEKMIKKGYQAIKLSYDYLGSEEAKSCFLLCCSYPKSTNIWVPELVIYVLGFGVFEGINSMETGRDRVKSLVSQLKSYFLLSDGDDEESVRMDDIVHEVGSIIASDLVAGKFVIGNGVELKNWPLPRNLELQDLPTLKNIWKIKMQSECLRNLEDLEELKIQKCWSLETIFVIEGSGHHKEEANEISFVNLTRLALTDLPNFTGISKRLPEAINKETNPVVSVQHLLDSKVDFPMLSELEIEYLDSFELIWKKPISPKSFYELRVLKVNNCGKLLHLVPKYMQNRLQKIEKIDVSYCSSLEWIFKDEDEAHAASTIFPDSCELRALEVNNCGKLLHLVPKYMQNRLQKLEKIEVSCCSSFEGIFEYEDEPHAASTISEAPLRNLTSLIIHQCHHLSFLLSSYMAKSAVQLKYLKISECQMIEEIVLPAECDKESMNMFSKLKQLELSDLPNLTSFCSGSRIEFQSLEKLRLDKCTKLESFITHPLSKSILVYKEIEKTDMYEFSLFDEKVRFPRLEELTIKDLPKLTTIWRNQLAQDSFGSLKDVTVQKCNSLINILPDSIVAVVFQQLQKLTVEECAGVEEIVTQEVGETLILPDKLVLPELTCLECKSLPQLKRFYPRMHCFKFPQLKTLVSVGLHCCISDVFAVEFSSLPEINDMAGPCTPVKQSFVLKEKSSFFDVEDLIFHVYIWYGSPAHAAFYEQAFILGHTDDVRFKTLRLHGLEKLTGPTGLDSHAFDILVVKFCGLNNPELSSISFENLTILEVTCCWGLKYLTTYSVAKSLVKLKKLKVDECKGMKEILASDGIEEDAGDRKIVFTKLQRLELCDLINLERFCSPNFGVHVPVLKTSNLEVNWCPFKLKISEGVLEEDFSILDVHYDSKEEEAEVTTGTASSQDIHQKQPINSEKIDHNESLDLDHKRIVTSTSEADLGIHDILIKLQADSRSQRISEMSEIVRRLQEEMAKEAMMREEEQKLAGRPASVYPPGSELSDGR